MRSPDEDYDVICHQVRERDGRGVWIIWLAGETLGALNSFPEALDLARYVAATCSRPAWLLDETGYPLKPIES